MSKKVKRKKKRTKKKGTELARLMNEVSENNRTVPKAVDSWWNSFAKICDVDKDFKAPKGFKFDNPYALWEACRAYFVWVDDNPLLSEQVNIYKGNAIKTQVSKRRPATLEGLLLYVGISRTAWDNYKEHEAFEFCCEQVEDYIYVQKYEGAATGLLNPQIIARDLGLKDVREVNTNIKGDITTKDVRLAALVDVSKYSTKELKMLDKLINKPDKKSEIEYDKYADATDAEIVAD